MKKALLLGSTGLIGSHLLQLLLENENYETVIVFVRRPLPISTPKLRQIILSTFVEMENYKDCFQVDEVFCCVGTTMRKAKTKEQFREVDFTLPLLAATIAKQEGVNRFLFVSAMGANVQSWFFYNRVKGEAEKAIQELWLPAFLIFRPSLLLGKRNEFRLGEKLSTWISQLFPFLYAGSLQKYRPIKASSVSAVMLRMAQTYLPGTQIFDSEQMHKLAKM